MYKQVINTKINLKEFFDVYPPLNKEHSEESNKFINKSSLDKLINKILKILRLFQFELIFEQRAKVIIIINR